MKITYLNLTTTDPAYNLAVEEYVFEHMPRDRAYFMLWQNDNAVIVGKHQNTLAEINESYIKANGIRVVRRLSGGGAVYHDLGNLNFTFITDADQTDQINFRQFCQPVIRALASMGIQAETNGRNDLTVAGQKISGNAQYIRGGRVMHHGTLLFCSDLEKVSLALQVDPEKIAAKGIKSVRSRVTNIADHMDRPVSMEHFRAALLDQMKQTLPGEEYVLNAEEQAAVDQIRRSRYDTWEWNYGSSPECTLRTKQRIEGCGTVEAFLTLDHGRVTAAHFRGDYFSLRDPDELAQKLIGCRHDAADYKLALEGADASEYIMGLTTPLLLQLLTQF